MIKNKKESGLVSTYSLLILPVVILFLLDVLKKELDNAYKQIKLL